MSKYDRCPSFDPRSTDRDNPFEFLREARSRQRVFYSESMNAWCVTRYDDVVDVLRDEVNFSVREHNPRPTATLPSDVERVMAAWRGGSLPVGSLDHSEHTRVRAVVATGFTRRALMAFEHEIRSDAHDRLRQLAAKEELEFIDEFSKPFMLAAILRVLGISECPHDQLHTWTSQRIRLMTAHEGADADELRGCAQGLLDYGEFARALVVERLARPRNDLISHMLQQRPHGPNLSADEVIAQIPTLITAGYRTSAEALATIVWNQARTPRGWSAVVDKSVPIDDLIEEGLRFDCPIAGMYRTAVHDVSIGGIRIPAGDRVLLLYTSANRDETHYSFPDQFQPTRATTSHLAFGLGEHFCIGAPVARLTLRIALEELTTALPGLCLADSRDPAYMPIFPFRARQSALRLLTT
jgi:cytochrome P450